MFSFVFFVFFCFCKDAKRILFPQIVNQFYGPGFVFYIESGHVFHHFGRATRLVDVEINQCTGVAAEHHLIGRICLLAHRHRHDGRIVFRYAPVIFLVAIVVHAFIGHLRIKTSRLVDLYPKLKEKCGAFVTLHEHGRLRGCIGHFGEDVPLHETVALMARAAAFEDPRFTPVRRDELDDISLSLSVLTPMRRIQSLDEFELHRHGIYIKKGRRSGTFLPQVADEVNWTKEEFVGHCSRDKAGIGWDGWRDAELYVYEAIVF